MVIEIAGVKYVVINDADGKLFEKSEMMSLHSSSIFLSASSVLPATIIVIM